MPMQCSNEDLQEKEKNEDIKDSFYLVRILFFLLGLANFIPVSFFTTASKYWMYKFRNVENYTDNSSDRTWLQSHFSAGVTLCSTLPTVFVIIVSKAYLHKFDLKIRTLVTLISTIVPFVVATVFVFIDTDSWQAEFFGLTLILIIICNATNGSNGINMYEIMAHFPPVTLGYFIAGQGVTGIFNSLLQIVALAIGTSTTASAIIYFVTGTTILCGVAIMFMLCQKLPYYKFYISKKIVTKRDSVQELYEAFKKVWKISVMFGFLIIAQSTLHPTITSLVVSENEGSGQWSDKYFTPVITFLLNTTMEFFGRIAASIKSKSLNGTIITIVAFVRLVVFFFLIIFCNAQPRYHLSVLFPHDYQYIIILTLFAFSGGFFFSVTFTTVGNYLPPDKLNTGFSALIIFTSAIASASSILSFFTVNIL